METQNYTPFLGIAGYLVAKWLLDRFHVTNKILRVAALVLAPAVTAGGLVAAPRIIDNYLVNHSVTYGEKQFEDTLFKQYPPLRAMAEIEPDLWQKVRKDVVTTVQAHGGKIDEQAAQQLATIFSQLNDKIKKVGGTADDDHIYKWLTAEKRLTAHLLRENVGLCAGHLLGNVFDQTAPSATAVNLQREVQTAMVDSYIAARKAPVAAPTKEAAILLIRKAASQPDPLTDDEIATVSDPDAHKPVEVCRAWDKLYGNALVLGRPDAVNLMRYLLVQ